MKVLLLKPHQVNGHTHPAGAILELSEGSVANLVEWGVGERYQEAGRVFTATARPLGIPDTKKN
jgi:hypothetical protein